MIKTVAFLSITIVILIFVFVFRETLPIFRATKAAGRFGHHLAKLESDVLQPESYSPGEPEPSEELRPETYGAVPETLPDFSTDDTTAVSGDTCEHLFLRKERNQKCRCHPHVKGLATGF